MYNQTFYAAQNTNKKILLKSSSGGVFYELAKYILDKEGIVFGAAWNSDWLVDMKYIDKLEDLPQLMGSKYIKANIKNTLFECRDFLENNKYVLYSGTPCQIFALKSFLKKDYDKLFTVEVACEGTMPTSIWLDYLDTIKRTDAEIVNINLRDKKDTTWNNYRYTITYSDGKILNENHLKNKYSKTFICAKYMNQPCLDCKAKVNSGADLTIGDYWGVEKYHKELDTRFGVSFIRVNTEQGNDLLQILKNNFKLIKTTKENVENHNSGIKQINNIKQEKYSKELFKKKVAIVTMNLHFNIGTALQAYALQKIIKDNGYLCDVITWKRSDRLPFCDKYINMRVLPTSQDYDKIKESDYDIFIVGSDQIWRKNTSLKDYKENYINYPFLNFTIGWNKVRFSYAASFGLAGKNWAYDNKDNERISEILKQFNNISVRELASVKDCKDKLSLEVVQNIDPTLLLPTDSYLELCSDIPKNKDKNIFKYILFENQEKRDFIDTLSKKFNIPIKTHNKNSVTDWLSKIRDTNLVITDSFHGVVFSIIFNKPFLYYSTRDSGGARFETLDKLFNISSKEINKHLILDDSIFDNPNIDYSYEKEKAINYIKNNLTDCPKKLLVGSKNLKNWKKNNKQAWMLFLSSDNYIYYVLNTYKNLLDTNTKYAVCCGCTKDVSSETIKILKKCGIVTFRLDTSAILHENVNLKKISNWIKAFTKLGLLKNQLNLDKMIYLDSDLGIYDNIDELFNKPHMSAVLDGAPLPNRKPGPYQTGDSIFCSGLFVWDFKNNNDAENLIKILPDLPKNIDWHDQNVLNYFYKDWQNKKELHLDYTYGLMTTNKKIDYVNIDKNWPKVIHYIAGQGEKTKIPFIDKKFYLQDWCDMPLIDKYYETINKNIQILMNAYNFTLPLINTQNIIHPSKTSIDEKTKEKENTLDLFVGASTGKYEKKSEKAKNNNNTLDDYSYFF